MKPGHCLLAPLVMRVVVTAAKAAAVIGNPVITRIAPLFTDGAIFVVKNGWAQVPFSSLYRAVW